MKFTTYDNNRPLGRYDCPDWEVEVVANGQNYIQGWAKENQYILNGQFVDMPERPSDIHIWDWDSLAWVQNLELAKQNVLRKRQELLEETDWTQLPDVPESTRLKYQAYRQALRDITLQDGYPQNTIFPELE